MSPSLSPRLSLFRSSLLRLLLHRVNTPIRTRGPTCARTHRPRVVSFGPLLPRQLATARPPHGQEYRVSEYHRDHPFERRVAKALEDPRDVTSGSASCRRKNRAMSAASPRARHQRIGLNRRPVNFFFHGTAAAFAISHESSREREREEAAPGAR